MDLNEYIRDHPEESNRQIAQKFNVSTDIVRNRRNRMNAKKETKVVTVEEAIVKDIKKLQSKQEEHTTDKKYKTLIEQNLELKQSLEAMLQISGEVQPVAIKPSYKLGVHEGTTVSVASDWHADEIVDPKKVNNRNAFNPGVAEKRANAFFVNTLKLIKKEQQDTKIDTHILALLGDFISGNIHEELLANTSMRPIMATLFVQNLIVGGIQYLLDNSKLKLVVPCCVGNHSRITEKVHDSNEQGNSLEYLMYHNIKNHFRNEKRVEMIIADGYHLYMEVYGYTQRFHHGHAFTFNNGIGGPEVSINRSIKQWNDKDFFADNDVFGHLHMYMPGRFISGNSSFIGYGARSVRNKYPYEVPTQSFFLILKGRGKVGQFPIFLE